MDLSERRGGTPAVRHPWEQARVSHVRSVLQRHMGEAASSVLDVGAGDGYVAAELHRAFPQFESIICCDAHYTPEDLAVGSGSAAIERVRALPATTFDVLLLLDVIEHVEDSLGLLRALRRDNAHEKTVAVVTVPAHPRLFSEHDVALGHFRRYTTATLHAELDQAGWVVRELGGFFALPLAARLVGLLRERRTGPQEAKPSNLSEWQHGRRLTAWTTSVLRADAAVNRVGNRLLRTSAGLSLWAVATPRPHD